jgi:hypothetical protein
VTKFDRSAGYQIVAEFYAVSGADVIDERPGRFLRDAGLTLIAADSPDSFLDETPTAVLIHQVLGE